MEEHEERNYKICVQVSYISASENGTPITSGFASVTSFTRVEMGACYNGFC